jgi:hypothetical protein
VSLSGVALNGPGLVQANPQSFASQLQQGFKQLTSSLQSGNLESAQKAFASIQNALKSTQTGSSASSKPPVNVQSIQNDVGALSQALFSGDLSSALSAYNRLQTDLWLVGSGGSTSGGSGVAPAESATGKKTDIYG